MVEIDKDNLEKKITVLDEDIQKVSDLLVKLEKDKANALATMNALQGAKSQCVTFIKELHDDYMMIMTSQMVLVMIAKYYQ